MDSETVYNNSSLRYDELEFDKECNSRVVEENRKKYIAVRGNFNARIGLEMMRKDGMW